MQSVERRVDGTFTGPLFVVGMPRSGTKLLRSLLSQHPLIGIPEAETEFLPHLAQHWPELGDLRDPACWAAFVARMRGAAYFVYLEEERGLSIDGDAWRAACPDMGLAGVFEGLCRLHGDVPEGGIWGDKSPGYLHHLGLLRTLWPQARLVNIVRDVRDHVLSMEQAWGKDPLRSAVRWTSRVAAADAALVDWGPQAHTIRYEDLVQDVEGTMRGLCGALRLPYSDAMLALAKPTENLGDARGQTTVMAGNVEKWRARMDPALATRITAIARDSLAAHGYPVDPSASGVAPGAWDLRRRQLKDGLRLVRFDTDARGWRGAARFRWRIFQESGAWD